MKINIKRVYDEPEKSDGYRILVDSLWPRGLTKGEVQADLWLKGIAPSAKLRKMFGHDPEKWGDFECAYFAELDGKRNLVREIVDAARVGTVTLLFGAKDERRNNAVALKEYILTKRHEIVREAA